MDRKIIIGIVLLVVVVIIAAIVLPGGQKADKNPKLPWQITVNDQGQSSVLGITLDKTTLAEAEDNFADQPTLSLFRSPEGKFAVEAYFDHIFISGLKANVVLKLKVSEAMAKGMFERGLRISKLGSGTQKVELSEGDQDLLAKQPVELITYLPATDLDPELIAKRFGEPAKKVKETAKLEHWLYPDKGLDIAVSEDTKEVFQYLLPSKFNQATQSLQKAKP